MVKISSVTVTLNEEKKIGRCLQSMKGIVDEMIVVDSFSTDRTEEICLENGAVFSKHPFAGYIEQKTYAISLAKYDYILLVDADEEVSDEMRDSILKVKENWTHDGYSFNRLNSFCGKWIRHSGWYPDRKVRLFDRHKNTVKGSNPHEEFVMNNGTTLKHLKGDLLHYTYETVEDQIRQIDRFTTIQAKEAFAGGKKASWFLILFGPCYKFFRHYFIQLGFLDGFYGFLICRNMAHSTFLKHAKLKAMWKVRCEA